MSCTAIQTNFLQQETEELLQVINKNIPIIEHSNRWDVSGKIDWDETGTLSTPLGKMVLIGLLGWGQESEKEDSTTKKSLKLISEKLQTTILRITKNSVICPKERKDDFKCFNSFFLQETVN